MEFGAVIRVWLFWNLKYHSNDLALNRDMIKSGERNLYVLNEDGAIKLQKRLDYNAYCIAPYIATDEGQSSITGINVYEKKITYSFYFDDAFVI